MICNQDSSSELRPEEQEGASLGKVWGWSCRAQQGQRPEEECLEKIGGQYRGASPCRPLGALAYTLSQCEVGAEGVFRQRRDLAGLRSWKPGVGSKGESRDQG